MKAVVIENTWLPRELPGTEFRMDFGWGNGYVVLDDDHPANGLSCDDINVWAPGGLTYAGAVGDRHLQLCPELNEEDLGKWMVGFDTAHYNDTLEKWPKEAVQQEADELMQKLMEYEK